MFGREPALWIALIEAVVALGIAIGFDISPEMVGAVSAFLMAIGAIFTRARVTPVVKPTSPVNPRSPS